MSQSGISAGTTVALSPLAKHEIKRYARHPLFLLGAAITIVSMVFPPDKDGSSVMSVIVPAACLGLFGLVVMVSLVRSSDHAQSSAGTVVASERSRTLALAWAVIVPFAVGLVWFAWAVFAYHHWPATARSIPFGDVGDSWAYANLFALGALSSAGGPILGLVIGRWVNFRASGPIFAVVVVLVTIIMQGIVEPLRFVRVIAPWTYFGGPYGIAGDGNRWLILTGSPQWYCAYLVALGVAGILFAVLHDTESPHRHDRAALILALVVAAVLCILAMTMGVQHVMVNPIPSG